MRVPLVGLAVSVRRERSVDFPAPLRPTIPMRSPMWMVRLTFSRTNGAGGVLLFEDPELG